MVSERYETPPPEPSADPEGPGDPTGPLPAAPAPIGVGRLDRPAVGWTEIAVGAVAYLVLQIGLAVPLILFYRGPPPGVPLVLLAAVAALGAVGIAAAMRVRSLAALGLRRTSGRALLLGLAAGVLAWLVGRGIILGYTTLTGDHSNPQQSLAAAATGSTANLLGLIVVGALLVPLGEELLFRGVLFSGLRRYGLVSATIVSALVFSAAHGFNVVGVTVVLLGVINALLYNRTRSIWPAVIAHGVNNAIIFISAAILLR